MARKGPKLLKLNLASGQNPMEGFLNVDKVKAPGVDRVVDLLKFPWPFADASVEEAACSHFVEHIPMVEHQGRDLLICWMEELYRVLVPGGTGKIITPYWSSVRAWQDPTHRRAISEATFLYFNKEWRATNKLDHYPITADFDFTYGYDVDMAVAQRHEDARSFAFRHYVNSINDLHVHLTRR